MSDNAKDAAEKRDDSARIVDESKAAQRQVTRYSRARGIA